MSLAHVQRALAKLYTDSELRERFFADRQRGAEALGLNSDDAQQVGRLSAHQVSFFARSLQRKRLNETRKLLPLTHRVLGGRFATLFERYADTHVAAGTKKHRDDAVAFSAFVEQIARVDGVDPPWAAEVTRYEAAWLTASDPTRRWTVRLFRHPVRELIRRVMQGDLTPSVSTKPTLALWLRLSPRASLHEVLLSPPGSDYVRRM